MRRRRVRRGLIALAILLVAPWVALFILAAFTPLPPELAVENTSGLVAGERNSLKVVDRSGATLFELRDENGRRSQHLPLAAFGDRVPAALVAAEDGRFRSHFGVDPIAMARAALTSLFHGRVVSGASTLTQQLARTLTHAPRTLKSKVSVMALAVRIEASLSKDRILDEYLNRVEFGPNLEGAEAAAQYYFGRPARDLSWAQAATLASIPRGPTVYDPTRAPTRLTERRDWVLDRLVDRGVLTADEARTAKSEPLLLAPRFRSSSAPHFGRRVAEGRIDPCGAPAPPPAETVEIETALVGDLQAELTMAARSTVDRLSDSGVSAASIVVLDNQTGDILAYVGSPDVSNVARLGQNDGVLARRQPGSSLKPFVYELAFERLGMTPATMLPDVQLSFENSRGDVFRPDNYDQHFHGPVLLRFALGNSYNVPAVWTADRLGPPAVLERLHQLGFCSLDGSADEYGVALALGDGEVTLLELARAYSVLARGGTQLPIRAASAYVLADGTRQLVPVGEATRVLDERSVALITDILKDRHARRSSFGEETVFDLPFEVAAKTGTSKGYRDNVAVGYTPRLTVAVWVGNFDGSPMHDVSGITGAGPLFHVAMDAAARLFPSDAFTEPSGLERLEVCSLSGKTATPDCPHRRTELVPAGRKRERERCDMHERVRIDKTNGLLAGPACDTAVEERVFERYPALLVPWAVEARRELAPVGESSRCPGALKTRVRDEPARVVYPEPDAVFYLTDHQRSFIVARVAVARDATSPTLEVDGEPHPLPTSGTLPIELVAGEHTLVPIANGRRGDVVHFTVE